MKRINSRAKGARMERQASEFLNRLGFKTSRNARNGLSAADLDCSGCPVLSKVHIEVKADRSIGLGTVALYAALEQARTCAPGFEQWQNPEPKYAVLWYEYRKGWRLSWRIREYGRVPVTTDNPDSIRLTLGALSRAAPSRPAGVE